MRVNTGRFERIEDAEGGRVKSLGRSNLDRYGVKFLLPQKKEVVEQNIRKSQDSNGPVEAEPRASKYR